MIAERQNFSVAWYYKNMLKDCSAENVVNALKKFSSKKRAESNAWFFKTGKGEYGEGDKFLGVIVPDIRKTIKHFCSMSLPEVGKLIRSPYHEARLAGFLILVDEFKKGDNTEKNKIFDFYIKNTKHANNWDLVDLSAPHIVGGFLFKKKKDILYKLARSQNLWEKRISIISTMCFIYHGDFKDTLRISKILLSDSHDLIHKAVGWMLREVGKKDQKTLENFLDRFWPNMPRTTLRYAIERFPQKLRFFYLNKKHK